MSKEEGKACFEAACVDNEDHTMCQKKGGKGGKKDKKEKMECAEDDAACMQVMSCMEMAEDKAAGKACAEAFCAENAEHEMCQKKNKGGKKDKKEKMECADDDADCMAVMSCMEAAMEAEDKAAGKACHKTFCEANEDHEMCQKKSKGGKKGDKKDKKKDKKKEKGDKKEKNDKKEKKEKKDKKE